MDAPANGKCPSTLVTETTDHLPIAAAQPSRLLYILLLDERLQSFRAFWTPPTRPPLKSFLLEFWFCVRFAPRRIGSLQCPPQGCDTELFISTSCYRGFSFAIKRSQESSSTPRCHSTSDISDSEGCGEIVRFS